jgi:cell pole-organizing protein PopZ
MEDILASIRRILSEEEGGPKAAAPEPAEPELPAVEPVAAEEMADEDDTLELDMAMMVPEETEVTDEPQDELLEEPEAPDVPMLEPAAAASAMTAPAAAGATITAEPLVAPEAAQVATSSIASLVSTLASERIQPVYRGGPTIEDLVREEMRPLLKQWLDTFLPPMVERLVRVEIERVVNRATP